MVDETPSTGDIKSWLDRTTKQASTIIAGVILVMGIGFVAVLIAMLSPVIDAWRFRSSSYEALVNKISEQGFKIDALTAQCANKAQPQQTCYVPLPQGMVPSTVPGSRCQ